MTTVMSRFLIGCTTLLIATSVNAQSVAPSVTLAVPGDGDEVTRRIALLGDLLAPATDRMLLRSASVLAPVHGKGWRVLPAFVLLRNNSGFPYSYNDGALWSGRGFSSLVRVAASYRRGPFALLLAPEAMTSANAYWLAFDVPRLYGPVQYPDRSLFSAPWYRPPWSIDAPWRFGPREIGRVDLGQTSATWTFRRGGRAQVGVANESHWWGPGIRNALLLSNNAGGFPHAFARTAQPVRTRLGAFEARWMLGGLTESKFFDTVSTNNTRSFTAAGIVWHARDTSRLEGLSVGLARAVYAPTRGWGSIPGHFLDVLASTPRSQRIPPGDTTLSLSRDQIASLFARWILREGRLEIHGELGRTELPISLRDALVHPEHTMAHTLGFQLLQSLGSRSLHAEFEITNTEQSSSFASRSLGIWYASRAVPQGYTQRGQPLGAAVGPSGASQWLALDHVAPTWRIGATAQRIRWNNDVLYSYFTLPDGGGSCEHDVTLAPGVRGAWQGKLGQWFAGKVSTELLLQNRLNYFFQNSSGCPNGDTRRDLRNSSLTITWSPR